MLNRSRERELDVPAAARRFQESVVDVLSRKTADAAAERGSRCVIIAGGVAANGALREALRSRCGEYGLPLRVPPPALCTDNAAMIGAAAHQHARLAAGAALDFDIYGTSGPAVFSPAAA